MDPEVDGVLWVEQVEDPSAFGVVELNNEGQITSFVEKPETFVSDKAMIGIYYFKQGEVLREEMEYLIDNNIMNDGEYQLPDALRAMVEKGKKFVPGTVTEWLDCGNYKATINTNAQWIAYKEGDHLIDKDVRITNSIVIQPCYIGKGVELSNSIIGPYVSLDGGNKIEGSIIKNAIVGQHTSFKNVNIKDSMIGNHSRIDKDESTYSVGDYNQIGE